jgi:hypothetical protein
MFRFIFLVLLVFITVWGINVYNPQAFTKDNMEATIKKEKTINAVQRAREKRRLEAEKIMEQY